jgi:beta-phosphoglucomutase-like phosphatase (HAD superfamily)
MQAILEGRGRVDAFQPAPGLKDFLLQLKDQRVRIALVTSGLYEKAWPVITAVFRQLGLGEPQSFYDAIITAGFPMRDGQPGTLGELSPKPHPWLYAEAARVGLGLDADQRHHIVGLEDSAAGIVSILLAGFSPIGLTGGNIETAGTRELCADYCENFQQILNRLR